MVITDKMTLYAIKCHKIKGQTVSESAKKLGCSDSHLSKHMRAMGYFPNKKQSRIAKNENIDIYTRILCSKTLGLI